MNAWPAGLICLQACIGLLAQDGINLSVDPSIRVALSGELLTFVVTGPRLLSQNDSKESLVCSNAQGQQFFKMPITQLTSEKVTVTMSGVNSSSSGTYLCEYKGAKIFWHLQVRDEGYREPGSLNGDIIAAGTLTGVLLVLSVLGSIYVFKGGLDSGGKEKQSKDGQNGETTREEADITSVYTDLKARPASVYAVLDSAASNQNTSDGKTKTKTPQTSVKSLSKSEKSNGTKAPTNGKNEDGVFEDIYENV